MKMGIFATLMAISHAVVGSELQLENSIVNPCLDISLTQKLLHAGCPGSAGDGNSVVERWSFSHDTGECHTFSVPSTCSLSPENQFGTSNIFGSRKSCEDSCIYARCFLAPLASQCQMESQYWFYSPVNGTCLPYPAGSCPSSTNSFPDEIDCYAFCAKALCVVGMHQRPCRDVDDHGLYQRWYLNLSSGRCEQFSFQHCHQSAQLPSANLNNFLTEQECVDLCHCDEEQLPGIKCHPKLRELRVSDGQPMSAGGHPDTSIANFIPSTSLPTHSTSPIPLSEGNHSHLPEDQSFSTVPPQKHTNKMLSRNYVDPKPEFKKRTLHIQPRAGFDHLITQRVTNAEEIQSPPPPAERGRKLTNGQKQRSMINPLIYFIVFIGYMFCFTV